MELGAKKKLLRRAAAALAVALTFIFYVAAFPPFDAAEIAFVFAVPAILAARYLCRPNADTRFSDSTPEAKTNRKIWIWTTFAGSYAAWIAVLIWLRHVYPPAGWAAVAFLPFVIGVFFIFPWFLALPRFLPKLSESASARLLKLLGLAGLWTGLEWLRSWIFTGFPWALLAHTQWQRPAVIQSAEYGGVWIVSFTLIFVNLAVAEYFYRLYAFQRFKTRSPFGARPKFSRFCPEFYLALLMTVFGIWLYVLNIPTPANESKAFRAGLVQTDFAGILKWNDTLAKDNLEIIARLSEGARKSLKADVILWPEAATPPRWPVLGTPEMKMWVENLSHRLNAPILMGNMAYFYEEKAAQNAVFAVSEKTGLGKDFYAKRRLVPFGEYIPFWAKFIGKVVPVGDMKRGERSTPLNLEIAGKNYKIGPMICYEDIFPSLGREMAANGAQILFVCTNDSWYGRESGAWQHAANSAFQAVSTRLPLMRSSNNGLSTVFDQYGRMRPCRTLENPDGTAWNASTPTPPTQLEISDNSGRMLDIRTLAPRRPAPMENEKGSIYFRGTACADVVFYKNFDGKTTFYVRYGDWFAALSWAFFAIAAASDGFKRLRDRKKKLEVLY